MKPEGKGGGKMFGSGGIGLPESPSHPCGWGELHLTLSCPALGGRQRAFSCLNTQHFPSTAAAVHNISATQLHQD